ncbi:hypothetical protein Anas_01620 [Armadillidium nasatum]|uniref:Uncharacterized protein n=1 Tax=Armadillidium nasatum TaxID=96803 RepID=A0A5N5SX71_9CRUS|nr:hypothetical protein Anas_01620 [Armadillidium nasatum]
MLNRKVRFVNEVSSLVGISDALRTKFAACMRRLFQFKLIMFIDFDIDFFILKSNGKYIDPLAPTISTKVDYTSFEPQLNPSHHLSIHNILYCVS